MEYLLSDRTPDNLPRVSRCAVCRIGDQQPSMPRHAIGFPPVKFSYVSMRTIQAAAHRHFSTNNSSLIFLRCVPACSSDAMSKP
ncbi:hypothetical protein Syun_017242 [Stephania yunnanensis]|uniref:Uncharacterized protein n=1 Tax=Stephania yunnanensis TaxID=152371 RepID=A0AAP0J858_9MAGN